MRTRVVVRRSGKWWAIESVDHPGVFSQAKRLEHVPAMAADALSAWLEKPVSPEDVDVEIHADDTLDELVAAAREARSKADQARVEATFITRQVVKRALDTGLPLRDIGQLIGVTHQRAAAIAREVS